jgi:phosphoglycolate phosphatase-like HAD superfamily hydrolase
MRFRTVLFDLDGTLMDHLPAIHRSYVHTLPQLGLPAPTYEQVKRAIGGGLENALLKFVPKERLAEALAVYRPFWNATMLSGAELMPGSILLLQRLHAAGVQCAVFTNKHGPSAREVCAHLGVTPYLAAIFGANDTPWLKPAREFTDHALKTLGAEAATTCLVGDSPWDVQAAVNAGFPCFAVTTGTHTGAELAAAGAAGIYDGMTSLGAAEFGLV